MKTKVIALAFVLSVAGPANADLIAGWDFSQYVSAPDGFTAIDVGGTPTPVDTLAANYSDLDPNGLGLESAAYGTMYINGAFGSIDKDPFAVGPVSPRAGNIIANQTVAAVDMGSPAAYTILLGEGGQSTAADKRLVGEGTSGLLNVVFGADLSATTYLGSAWEVSFAGRTASGTSDVGIEFSSDGTTYNPIGSVQINASDAAYSVLLGGVDLATGFVRLVLDSADDNPAIDNVAISASLTTVPEPGTAVLMLAGLAGLVTYGRRRAA